MFVLSAGNRWSNCKRQWSMNGKKTFTLKYSIAVLSIYPAVDRWAILRTILGFSITSSAESANASIFATSYEKYYPLSVPLCLSCKCLHQNLEFTVYGYDLVKYLKVLCLSIIFFNIFIYRSNCLGCLNACYAFARYIYYHPSIPLYLPAISISKTRIKVRVSWVGLVNRQQELSPNSPNI